VQKRGNNMCGKQVTGFLHPFSSFNLFRSVLTICMLALSFMVTTANAGNFTGIYYGLFSDAEDNGGFSVYVRNDDTAVVIGYEAVDNFGFINPNVPINPLTGAFSHSDIDGRGTSISGTISGDNISGSGNSLSFGSFTFSGNKKSNHGVHFSKGGYYEGTFQSTPDQCYGLNIDGFSRGILAADGTYYFYIEVESTDIPEYKPVGAADGGIVQLDSIGNYSGSTFFTTTVNGAVSNNLVNGDASDSKDIGSFQDPSGCIGTYEFTRTEGLIDYSDDFGGDGKADILIRHSLGTLYLLEIDGRFRTTSSVGGLSTAWTVKGLGDFGGDDKTDILIRHTSGLLYLYEMDGNVRTGSMIGALNTSWRVEGIGDFGGDRMSDMLLRHISTGQLYLYEMDGNTITGSNIGGLSTAWAVVGLGDFGGDGKSDILIRNTSTGQLYLYEMDGNAHTGSNIGGLGINWDVAGIGDFGGDGKDDILIRNSVSGQLYLFEMDGATRTGSNIGALAINWDVAGIGDFGGDGKDDILIRNSVSGHLYIYKMDGSTRKGSSIGGLSTDWTVERVADYGGDGKADILIRHKTSGQLYLYEMDGNIRTGSNIGDLSTSWEVEVQ
jgi:hypothetical protein